MSPNLEGTHLIKPADKLLFFIWKAIENVISDPNKTIYKSEIMQNNSVAPNVDQN